MALVLASLVETFLVDRATLTRRGLTPASQGQYRQDLVTWARHLAQLDGRLGDPPGTDEPGPLSLVTVDDLTEDRVKKAYRVIRTTEAPSTVQRRVGTLRLFCHGLLLEGNLEVDPTLRIEAPTRPERLPAGWDDDELARLAAAARDVPVGDSRRWPARDWAAFALLATTGLRAAELCSLTDRSLHREPGGEVVLQVIGKGNKQRNIPVPPEAMVAVDAYRAERDARFGKQDPAAPLLRLTNGSALSRSSLNNLVDRWIRLSGADKQAGEAAHGFRHTFAKGLIRQGVPAPTVQALLGHSSLVTTSIYLKSTANDTRDASLLSPARRILAQATEQR